MVYEKKKGLGRGLMSLFGDQEESSNLDVDITKKADPNSAYLLVSIGDLNRNRFQPRMYFNQTKIDELAKSIKQNGIIQPIAVRRDKNETYEIVAGERRWLAAQKAGLHEVPVVVTAADDLKSLELAIVENVQRNDLNVIEEALGYQRLIGEFAYDQEKVAKFIGKSRSHIANCLRLLSLPAMVLKLIETKKLSPGHAKIMVGLPNVEFIANKIIEKSLSVRQAETFIKIFKIKKQSHKKPMDVNLKALESKIQEKIGLNVSIKNKKNNTGSLVLEYKSLDQLNKIIEIIKINY